MLRTARLKRICIVHISQLGALLQGDIIARRRKYRPGVRSFDKFAGDRLASYGYACETHGKAALLVVTETTFKNMMSVPELGFKPRTVRDLLNSFVWIDCKETPLVLAELYPMLMFPLPELNWFPYDECPPVWLNVPEKWLICSPGPRDTTCS